MTLDGVFDFFNKHEDIDPTYKVFKEYFVVCWCGKKKTVSGRNLLFKGGHRTYQ